MSVAPPGNSGATTYVYEGNAVTVTSPSGKWKKYTTDALGNLVQVTEPDPALGNVQTNYTYNLRGQLTLVSMPRGGTTQTRTFNFDLATGRLTSATNPENETVAYTYNADGSVATKTDAKGQRNDYSYDSFGRVTQKRGYACSSCSAWPYANFYYDSGVNAWGRLSSFDSNGPSGPVTQMFTYTPAGLVEQKWDYPLAASFNTYDNEGRTVSTYYPFGGPSFTYTYDAMGRPIGLRDNQPTPVDWVKDVAYNAAGQITAMSYARDPGGSSYYTETRQYNILQRLTRLTVPGVMDHEYRFSSTQNDGRITQRKDWVSGEEITYQYDTLNRLISAQTTSSAWGQSFGYDGFGNLLSQTVTKGSAPSLNVTVDPATNRITNSGMSYDANGNLTSMPGRTMTYDTDNRMITTSGNFSYVYDPAGQRVRKNSEVFFYGLEGNLLATSAGGYNVYFGSKLIYNSGGTVVTDRLGSVMKKDPSTTTRYFPYGDEPATTEQNRPKFATYYRDSVTALDYAQQRYYASTLGRFTSPDPYDGSADPADPQSWNRYPYVLGDPVNYVDPEGLVINCGPYNRSDPTGRGCIPLLRNDYGTLTLLGLRQRVILEPKPSLALLFDSRTTTEAQWMLSQRVGNLGDCGKALGVDIAKLKGIVASTIFLGFETQKASNEWVTLGQISGTGDGTLLWEYHGAKLSPPDAFVLPGGGRNVVALMPNYYTNRRAKLNPDEVAQEYSRQQNTLLHEVLHLYGLSDDRLGDMVQYYPEPPAGAIIRGTHDITRWLMNGCQNIPFGVP